MIDYQWSLFLAINALKCAGTLLLVRFISYFWSIVWVFLALEILDNSFRCWVCPENSRRQAEAMEIKRKNSTLASIFKYIFWILIVSFELCLYSPFIRSNRGSREQFSEDESSSGGFDFSDEWADTFSWKHSWVQKEFKLMVTSHDFSFRGRFFLLYMRSSEMIKIDDDNYFQKTGFE